MARPLGGTLGPLTMLIRAAGESSMDSFEPALALFFRKAFQGVQNQVRYVPSRFLLISSFFLGRHRCIPALALGEGLAAKRLISSRMALAFLTGMEDNSSMTISAKRSAASSSLLLFLLLIAPIE